MSFARGVLIFVVWASVLAVILVSILSGASAGQIIISALAVGGAVYLTQFIWKTQQVAWELNPPSQPETREKDGDETPLVIIGFIGLMGLQLLGVFILIGNDDVTSGEMVIFGVFGAVVVVALILSKYATDKQSEKSDANISKDNVAQSSDASNV